MKLIVYTAPKAQDDDGFSDTLEYMAADEVIEVVTDENRSLDDNVTLIDNSIAATVLKVLPSDYDHDIIDRTCAYTNYETLTTEDPDGLPQRIEWANANGSIKSDDLLDPEMGDPEYIYTEIYVERVAE